MHYRPHNQDHDELKEFIKFIRVEGIRKYCEIGCRNGDTFFYVMRAIGSMGLDAWGAAVDLPENENSKANLAEVIRDLIVNFGHKSVFAYWGDSNFSDTIRWVRYLGPFDLILIDGDHTFEGVARDFLIYRDMTRFIAFHDISAPDDHMSDGKLNGVGKFWRRLEEDEHVNQYKIVKEIITPGSNMGFGIIEMLV